MEVQIKTKPNFIFSFFLILMIFLPLHNVEAGELWVSISGVRQQTGNIYIALFDKRENYEVFHGYKYGKIVEVDRYYDGLVVFEDVNHGRYAIVAYHDINANGILDRGGIYNIPMEPTAFGNGARNPYGIPDFSVASIEVKESPTKAFVTFDERTGNPMQFPFYK